MAFRLVVEYNGNLLVEVNDCTYAEYNSGELQWQSETDGPGSEFLRAYVYQNNAELKGGEIWDGSDGDVFLSVYDEEQNFGGTDPGTNPETPEITLTLIPASLSLFVGRTGTITATTNSQQSITWNSNDATIATVNSSGNSATVTAISSGDTKITASVEGITKSCIVIVEGSSDYTLNIYDESKTEIIKTTKIPKNSLINKYLYENEVYNEINDKDAHKDGYYISEWKNRVTDGIISDEQIMEENLDIYPGYTESPTKYYSIVYLPNLTQRFPLGVGSSYSLGDKGGEETVTLTSTECALPRHTHRVLVDTNHSSGYVKVGTLPNGDPASDGAHPLVQSSDFETDFTQDYSNKYNTPVVYGAEKHEADNPHTNMPPYLVVNFIIKYK